MIKAVLFDLDGTIVPMPPDMWTEEMVKVSAGVGIKHGYEPRFFVGVVKQGVDAFDLNKTDKVGIEFFKEIFKQNGINIHDKIYDSYEEAYNSAAFYNLKNKLHPLTADVKSGLEELKKRGLKIVLATNPIQSKSAMVQRLNWIGISEDYFDLITHYQNSTRTKATAEYYLEIINKLGIKPEEALMIGNDVCNDMSARSIGCSVNLVTDYLINKRNKDISRYPHSTIKGFFENLEGFVNQ